MHPSVKTCIPNTESLLSGRSLADCPKRLRGYRDMKEPVVSVTLAGALLVAQVWAAEPDAA